MHVNWHFLYSFQYSSIWVVPVDYPLYSFNLWSLRKVRHVLNGGNHGLQEFVKGFCYKVLLIYLSTYAWENCNFGSKRWFIVLHTNFTSFWGIGNWVSVMLKFWLIATQWIHYNQMKVLKLQKLHGELKPAQLHLWWKIPISGIKCLPARRIATVRLKGSFSGSFSVRSEQ